MWEAIVNTACKVGSGIIGIFSNKISMQNQTDYNQYQSGQDELDTQRIADTVAAVVAAAVALALAITIVRKTK